MSHHHAPSRSIIAVLLLAGCAPDAFDRDRDDISADVTRARLTSLEIDSSAIAVAPDAALPARPLPSEAFRPGHVVRTLIRTDERFAAGPVRVGSRERFRSPSWSLEMDAPNGRILILKGTPAGPPEALDESRLRTLALMRLASFGIPPGEIGRVVQRRSMAQHQDGDSARPTPPELHRHKTFVFRGLGGVPVEGHRAVVSHGPDGSFHRALVTWPPLAGAGHALRTPLTVAEIEARAVAALARAGESAGLAHLRWKFRPTPGPGGEVVLRLMVGAHLGAVRAADGTTEEPREIDVDVDAS
jgi:hypothetical protein